MQWDVAIVGAGMGGAAFGYALARAGHSVVFVEKGMMTFADDSADAPDSSDESVRLLHGRWPTQILGRVDGRETSFYPPLGCGAGGSTLLYAGTLERMAPADFENRPDRPEWPFQYRKLEPYYREAESLFRVRGSPDPFYEGPPASLRTPPSMSSSDCDLFNLLKRKGLQPYQLHNACEAKPGCLACGGTICHRACKHDAGRIFVEPALRTGRVTFLDMCTVQTVDADATTVKGLICRRNNEPLIVRAKFYALAAGALSTPLLLQRSANRFWPNGVANSSDMVGRNLMFHVSDFVAVWPRAHSRSIQAERSLAIRDFYRSGDDDFGIIQSTGMTATAGNIVHVLKGMIDAGPLGWLRPLRRTLHAPALVAAWLLGRATILATVLEDYPHPDNRVRPHQNHPEQIYFEYVIRPELRQRLRQFRRVYRAAFRPRRTMVLTPNVNLNFGHPCGTCRAGDDPRSSVVDRENRSHDLDNLFIVDASFFPRSGGVNPSLTIAANGLRVAELLSARLLQMKKDAPMQATSAP
ncbi:MAG: GMC oxidoreductase [Pseudorhizobium sp.]